MTTVQLDKAQREDRYIVIKRKDLLDAPELMRYALHVALEGLREHLPKRECLVIESDWPEYEPTWAAIQARTEGRAAFDGKTVADRLDQMADAMPAGSSAQSDLYAAATVWRKHLTGPAVAKPVVEGDVVARLTEIAYRDTAVSVTVRAEDLRALLERK